MGMREDNTNLSRGENCYPHLNIRCNCLKCIWISIWSKFRRSYSKRKSKLRIWQYQHVLLPKQTFLKINCACRTNWENFDVSWIFLKPIFFFFFQPIRNLDSPLILPLTSAWATSCISIHEQSHLITQNF